MKRQGITLFLSAAAIATATLFISATKDDGTITRDGDTTIVNTKTIGSQVRGFKGSTAVKIYIRKNKVLKVEALTNRESPNFFKKTKSLLTAWNGKSVKKAQKMEVDAVSGATYSSNALIKNVQLGLEYYNKQK